MQFVKIANRRKSEFLIFSSGPEIRFNNFQILLLAIIKNSEK